MKKLLLGLIATALITPALSAQVRVQGHIRKDGTYVAPHYRSAPDNNIYNNYSTKPNINPYTGQTGTVNPYSQPAPSYGYQQPKTPCYYNCPN
jgi:hypothetical protein